MNQTRDGPSAAVRLVLFLQVTSMISFRLVRAVLARAGLFGPHRPHIDRVWIRSRVDRRTLTTDPSGRRQGRVISRRAPRAGCCD
jgi:hypothetical protein